MTIIRDEGRKTTVLHCQCFHKSQDELYGKGMRVFNKTLKDIGGRPIWRCTICKREQSA